MVYTVEPLWGAAFAWMLLGERWGPAGWVGASLILGECLLQQGSCWCTFWLCHYTAPAFAPGIVEFGQFVCAMLCLECSFC